MELVTTEIENALRVLSIPTNSFRLLPDDQGGMLYQELLAQFVTGGDRRWWWEAFSKPSSSKTFEDGNGFQKITELVPDPSETVWFVVEEDKLPFYPIYQATPAAIQQVIGECYSFEYYIIPKSKLWLLLRESPQSNDRCRQSNHRKVESMQRITRKYHAEGKREPFVPHDAFYLRLIAALCTNMNWRVHNKISVFFLAASLLAMVADSVFFALVEYGSKGTSFVDCYAYYAMLVGFEYQGFLGRSVVTAWLNWSVWLVFSPLFAVFSLRAFAVAVVSWLPVAIYVLSEVKLCRAGNG